ncbi:MAG: glycosyltransferase [Planctomycetota bacterium]|nr:MAG: glycosyltransferase [Planctomycetota bacterium]
MRILHISTRLILGGSQENTVLSCEGQARLGHEVHLAFGPIYGPEGSLLARVEAFNNRCGAGTERNDQDAPCRPITTHTVPSLVRELSLTKDRRCLHELRALIEQIQPDIVHTHSSKAGVLGRAAAWSVLNANARHSRAPRASEGTRPAVIHTIHGPPFMPIEGNALQRAKIRCKNHLYTLAERYAAKRCHTITSVADAMTEQFLARNIGTPSQYITVRSGMEADPFLEPRPGEERAAVRRELGLDAGDFVIGTVARLAEHKGHDDILDALGDDLRAPHVEAALGRRRLVGRPPPRPGRRHGPGRSAHHHGPGAQRPRPRDDARDGHPRPRQLPRGPAPHRAAGRCSPASPPSPTTWTAPRRSAARARPASSCPWPTVPHSARRWSHSLKTPTSRRHLAATGRAECARVHRRADGRRARDRLRPRDRGRRPPQPPRVSVSAHPPRSTTLRRCTPPSPSASRASRC